MRFRIVRIIIIAFIAYFILKLSMHGCKWKNKEYMLEKSDNLLAEKLKSHVYKLSHEIGNRSVFEYEKLEQTADYISEQFKSFNYEINYQSYTIYDKEVKNIIISKIGKQSPEDFIIVGEIWSNVERKHHAGKVYIFTIDGNLTANLQSPIPVVEGRFGYSVAHNGEIVVIGEPQAYIDQICQNQGFSLFLKLFYAESSPRSLVLFHRRLCFLGLLVKLILMKRLAIRKPIIVSYDAYC